MQYETYKYEKNGVKLEFSFPKDEKLESNKADFVDLLKEAVKELDAKG